MSDDNLADEPQGLRFYDKTTGRHMMLIGPGHPYAGWLCYRLPDGRWVTLREATKEDRRRLALAPILHGKGD